MDLPFAFADALIIAVLLISGLLAYFRGLVREVLSLATWIGAAFAAAYGFSYTLPYVRQVISEPLIANIVTGMGLFLASLVILTLVNHLISSRVKDSALGAIDRGLGFLFGLARGALLVCVAYIAATWFWAENDVESYLANARTMPIVRQGSDLLLQAVPKEMRKQSRSTADKARETTNQAVEAKRLLDKVQGGGAPAAGSGAKPSYNRSERSEMQRLIDSKQ